MQDLLIILSTLPLADPPDITPDWNAPFMESGRKILGWILAGAFMVALVALIICIAGVAGKGFGSSRYQETSSNAIVFVAFAVTALASINGIFGLLVGFDWITA